MTPKNSIRSALVSAGLRPDVRLLQLQGAYDSNDFGGRLYELSADLREKPASDIPAVFEKHLIAELAERRGVPVAQAFTYALFRPMSIDRLNTRFTRHFFGRVETLLAAGMRLQMKHDLKDLTTLKGAKTGFHIEHILSRNAQNLALFDGDEERFDQERNRLGGVLLLKGKDNISSNNELFADKLRSYANTLYWNETLRDDCYKSKLDFKEFVRLNSLNFRAMSSFGPDELEERHKLLFDLCQLIWPPVEPMAP